MRFVVRVRKVLIDLTARRIMPSNGCVEKRLCRHVSRYSVRISAALFQLGSTALQEREKVRHVPVTKIRRSRLQQQGSSNMR